MGAETGFNCMSSTVIIPVKMEGILKLWQLSLPLSSVTDITDDEKRIQLAHDG
jgi:hypothetical protein